MTLSYIQKPDAKGPISSRNFPTCARTVQPTAV